MQVCSFKNNGFDINQMSSFILKVYIYIYIQRYMYIYNTYVYIFMYVITMSKYRRKYQVEIVSGL